MNIDLEHTPVLIKEVIEKLNVKPNGLYVDGTVGLGGHSEAILRLLGPQGRLLALDVDERNLAYAKNRLQPFGDRTNTRRSNFRGLQEVFRDLNWTEVDGMLFDLGISSAQLDDPARGFTFLKAGPLDMRLNVDDARTAASVLGSIDEREFIEALTEFGEGRNARRLARAILHDYAQGLIKTTSDLAKLCARVAGRHGRIHPATKVFLALRCLVNDEMGAVRALLKIAPEHLKVGGRLAIISFHSIEDRIVKHGFKELAENQGEKKFRVLTKKPVIPTPEEERANPRSRSAKLRVLERVE